MLALGVCIGSSSISAAVLREQEGQLKLCYSDNMHHDGKIREGLEDILGYWGTRVQHVALTGKSIQSSGKIPAVAEPVAVEYAYRLLKKRYPGLKVVVSAGAETFVAYRLDEEGTISGVYTGNRCASGTGEFFLQQIARMGLGVKEAVSIADKENPLTVATRCSVFCKSDCTHALNKGIEKGRVVAGLCLMVARKIMGLMQQCRAQECLLVGGVSRIDTLVYFLKKNGISAIVPPEATYFEAMGAALWSMENRRQSAAAGNILRNPQIVCRPSQKFKHLPSIGQASSLVSFKEMSPVTKTGREENYVVGVDVGSTTTKAVLMHLEDGKIMDSVYLRTRGNPVDAARSCYRALARCLGKTGKVSGLGVTGSGRQIVGLHALSEIIINEIIAHATAALYFDPKVDTILEIGGQDAKFTLLQNGVPLEYAMNEACSAGTGSFLEEAAGESLGLKPAEIQEAACKAEYAPNFSTQCSAFIGSDIKLAIQAGYSQEEIAAGLVYSVCQNYLTRVKGSRAIGSKIFMQGGVCYNRAVPLAMAALLNKKIVVPPEPGLMGAFGVALEARKRLQTGQTTACSYDLNELADREISIERRFTCRGGKEKCDLGCTVSMLRVRGELYPFGGACSRYADYRQRGKKNEVAENPLTLRNRKYWQIPEVSLKEGTTVGINRSLLVHDLFPLYRTFFKALGCRIFIPSKARPEAGERAAANFCYPVELSYAYFDALLEMKPDWIFLPHISGFPAVRKGSCTCPVLQAEPYYLRAAYPEFPGKRMLTPVIDFSNGLEGAAEKFIEVGKNLGFTSKKSLEAYKAALREQDAFWENEKRQGLELLTELENDPEKFGVVIFGRPYNALAPEANLAIPQKFTSRGIRIIPHRWLPVQQEPVDEGMYWSLGQSIMQSAGFTAKHKQLFGCYITNFSCGPDSFLLSYFRETMGSKPALVLELDRHTADAGLDTRIEAFLDIVRAYLQNESRKVSSISRPNLFRPSRAYLQGKETKVRDARGKSYPLNHSRVKLVIPAMGPVGNKALAAVFRNYGVRTEALELPTQKELEKGRNYTSCKECLPLQLTAGSLLSYLENKKESGEITVYFMPRTFGPCRFGQYHVLLGQIMRKHGFDNIAFLSLSSANNYAGLPLPTVARAWQATVVSDVLSDIYYALLARAADRERALQIWEKVVEGVLKALEEGTWGDLLKSIKKGSLLMRELTAGRKKGAPCVLLTGEIYVRKDPLAQCYLAERLAREGITVVTSPVGEWLNYCSFLLRQKFVPLKKGFRRGLESAFKAYMERKIKKNFERSGYYRLKPYEVRPLIEAARPLINPALKGEAVLTVGGTLAEADHVDGVVAIGPFGCMPHRISEAVLIPTLSRQKFPVPFLTVESDAGAFPGAVETRLEVFIEHVFRRARKRNEI